MEGNMLVSEPNCCFEDKVLVFFLWTVLWLQMMYRIAERDFTNHVAAVSTSSTW
jgi:hypothetical protein